MTRTIKNTFTPVNRLPPEILSNVLENRTGDRDLIAATHVCRHWRSILTSNPSLWTCFRFTSAPDVDRTLTYLERSKLAPIHIKVDMGPLRGPEVFKYLAPHIARAKSLIIRGLDHADVHAACLLLHTPSPTLQYLEVCSHRGLVRFPEDFLGQRAPSLRSVSFDGIHPSFESHPPLPNLIELNLFLPERVGPFRVDALFGFLSNCPRLRKILINSKGTLRDIALDKIISLESLVELDYRCDPIGRILPCLRLPRLERLQVSSSLGPGQAPRLTDVLPHGGRTLLAGATEVLYYSYESSQEVILRGKGTNVSFTMFRPTENHTLVDWFPNETSIPFGQIEDLTVGLSVPIDFPVDVAIFRNLRIIRLVPWNVQSMKGFLRFLYPDLEAEIPCPSLQEIRYHCWGRPELLIDLVKERKRAGHQLALVWVLIETWGELDWQDLEEELGGYVGEVRIGKWDGMT